MGTPKLKRAALAIGLFAALTTGGFFVGRLLIENRGTSADQPDVVERITDLDGPKSTEEADTRFAGRLLGIYIAPALDGIPRSVLDEDDALRAAGCSRIDPEDVEDLALPRPLIMPAKYALAEPDVEGTNPWASACGGATRILGWRYSASGAEDIPATVTIVRTRIGYDTQDVAKSRVRTTDIGGRQAVVISPTEASGLGQRSFIYFPEDFGLTAIHAFNLSEDQLLDVGVAVGEATR